MIHATVRKKIVILYHANCRDGFGGAWAAWKKFGSRAEYLPLTHEFRVPRGLKNKTIYMIDIVYPKKILARVKRENKKVIVLDHHESAEEYTKSADEFVYTIKNSGAVIAWKYFHPKKPVPFFLKIIEERDIWRFKHRFTHALIADIMQYPFEFKVWSKLAKEFDNKKTLKEHIKIGTAIRSFEKQNIEFVIKTTGALATFEGYNVYVMNTSAFHSEVAKEKLSKKTPIAITWYRKGNMIKVSLRSYKNGVDVSKLAQKYGGGGHRAASGFFFSAKKPLPWKYKKKV